jgi:hypothetical protein
LQREAFAPISCEFDFRYSATASRLGVDDVERTERALKGVVGKRLTYRTANSEGPPYGKSSRKGKKGKTKAK